MYERFTDRARKVMQFANQEAQRLNHEYVGTEHVILGLLKEGSGVAANAMKNMNIDLGKLRDAVEKLVEPGQVMVTMGKLPMTPKAKDALQFAIAEASELKHNYVGTEHVLLGLLRMPDAVGCKALIDMGVTLERMRQEVLDLLGLSPDELTDLLSRLVAEFVAAHKADPSIGDDPVAMLGWFSKAVATRHRSWLFSAIGGNRKRPGAR